MCIVSMVYDQFSNQFPFGQGGGAGMTTTVTWPPVGPASTDIEAMRELVREFREAVDIAKKLDVLLRKPDCADPEKAKLEERVSELERRLDAMTTAGGRK